MRKVAILILCLSFFLAGCSLLTEGGQVQMQGDAYVLNGKMYTAVAGQADRDKLLGRTTDGIRVYGVKNDPEHEYLLDSFGELYLCEGYEADDADITGVFVEGKYYNDDELLVFAADLRAEARGESLGILESENIYSCQVYNTPKSSSIYLCYGGMEASSDILGYIERQEQGYLYVDIVTVRNTSLSGKNQGYDGKKIQTMYNDILDSYFR